MKVCSFDGCGRPHSGRGLCSSHHTQLRRRGWDASRLTPLGTLSGPLSRDDAELDVYDFEFLLSVGDTMQSALRRMGMHARTMCRRYELLDRKVPAGLWQLAKTPKAAS